MKTRPVNIPEFKELGNPAFAIDTPPEHISLSSIVFLYSLGWVKRGSSRTFFTNSNRLEAWTGFFGSATQHPVIGRCLKI